MSDQSPPIMAECPSDKFLRDSAVASSGMANITIAPSEASSSSSKLAVASAGADVSARPTIRANASVKLSSTGPVSTKSFTTIATTTAGRSMTSVHDADDAHALLKSVATEGTVAPSVVPEIHPHAKKTSDGNITATSKGSCKYAETDMEIQGNIERAFLPDSFSNECEATQNRPFLQTGQVPEVGMRVELLVFLNESCGRKMNLDTVSGKKRGNDGSVVGNKKSCANTGGGQTLRQRNLPFRLSGEIVEVKPMPTWTACDKAIPTSGKISKQQCNEEAENRRARSENRSYHSIRRVTNCDENEENVPTGVGKLCDVERYWRPATSPSDIGPHGGSLDLVDILSCMMDHEDHKKLAADEEDQKRSTASSMSSGFEEGSNKEERAEPTPAMLNLWKNLCDETKEQISEMIIRKLGVRHGQEVVCEARLNFDYDSRRGKEDGPWSDRIPFDGRDVWRFTLVADDSQECIWHADPTSFVDLGRERKARCWPWSEEDVLPFGRSGKDAPVHGHGPNGALSVHHCIGPFGCEADDHQHSFQATAA